MYSKAMLCTIAYISGIILSDKIGMTALSCISCAVILTALVLRLVTGKSKSALIAVIVIAFLGGVRLYSASYNPLYDSFGEKYITISGTVDSNPTETSGNYPHRYIVKTDNARYLDKALAVDSKIILNTDKNLTFGDKISASGFLFSIAGSENEYEYDYSAYYKSLGIDARLTALELTVTGREHSGIIGMIKALIYKNISENFSGNQRAYLLAAVLDDSSAFSDDLKITLRKTGILSCIYSSYVHISIILLLSGIFCRRNRFRLDRILFFCLIIYAVINAGSPNSLKGAAVLAMAVCSRHILGYSDKPRILFLFVLAMTIAEPLLIYNSGFMMSVISTYMVMVCYNPVFHRLTPIFNRLHLSCSSLRHLIVLWIIFAVFTVPVSALYFNGFTPYSVFLTPLLVPLILIILVLTPVLFIIPGACAVLIHLTPAVRFATDGINFIAHSAAKLPYIYNILPTPSPLNIICFYLVLWILLRCASESCSREKTKIIAVVLASFSVCAVAADLSPSLEIYFVNVGQGDGAVLHTNRGDTILIDGGGSADYQTDYNIGERVYLPYLISHGFNHIDVAILSHYHKDHAEGIVAAAENLDINTLVMPDTSPDNIYRKRLEEIALSKNIKIEYLMEADEIRFDSGLSLKFLSPDSSGLNAEDPNDTSLVVSVEFGEFTALFTGDSGVPVTDSYPQNADLLKVSHHGSNTASSQEFIDYVNPEYAVISVGRGNSYNLPSRHAVTRLKNSGAYILRTDHVGDIRFKVSKNGDIWYRTLVNSY